MGAPGKDTVQLVELAADCAVWLSSQLWEMSPMLERDGVSRWVCFKSSAKVLSHDKY